MAESKKNLQDIAEKSVEVANLLKTLGHPKRLLLLCHLTEGNLSVQELEEACEISQSQLSQFLKKFELMGLVSAEKEGRHIYYQIKDDRTLKLIQTLQNLFC